MSIGQPEREIRLVVRVESSAHTVDQLSAQLGATPDESWEIGSTFKFGSKEKIRQTSSWAAIERAIDDEDCIASAGRLVARLEPLVANFRALPSGVQVTFRILVDENHDVFGVGLDRQQVKFLAAIGADLDVSVVVWHDNPDEPAAPRKRAW